jgi:hypothetical protein
VDNAKTAYGADGANKTAIPAKDQTKTAYGADGTKTMAANNATAMSGIYDNLPNVANK